MCMEWGWMSWLSPMREYDFDGVVNDVMCLREGLFYFGHFGMLCGVV